MQTRPLTGSEIIKEIQKLVPPGAPEPQVPELVNKLQQLTQALIEDYQNSGRLQGDPFNEAWTRPLHLYEAEIQQQVQGKTVLVTGGEGCVGKELINKLVKLDAHRIISVDNARCDDLGNPEPIQGQAPNVILYAADVRDYGTLNQIFATEKPNFVFHLAAIRIPGLAEKIILTTVTSNIFGTQNVIRLCEEHGVDQCIFSSTGKASRYWTGEVYAASKKVCEWLFAHAAETGKVRYGMVRFTHMLNNSSMIEQIAGKVQQGSPINIHAPERYVAGQNVGEAVHLLLNSLIFSEPERLIFVLVRNLGWPTESLEVALHQILESGKNLPIYFQGIPIGYEESFFLGQVDWTKQTEINTLINALETWNFATISSSGDMIVSTGIPFSVSVLMDELLSLKALCEDATIPQTEIKKKLGQVVWEVAKSSLRLTSPEKLVQILRWGVNLKQYQRGQFNLLPYQPFIELVVQGLAHRVNLKVLENCPMDVQEFQDILSALTLFPSLHQEIAQMQQSIGAIEVQELRAETSKAA
jgi:nucleoside-diphosphate-sugar epimerase